MTKRLPAPAPVPAPPLPAVGSPSMAAVAAHQVRGPLSSVRLRLELLRDTLTGASHTAARREVSGVLHEVDRLSHVLEQVLAWGTVDRGADTPVETVDVLSVAASRVDAWSALASDRGVRLRMDGTAVTGRHVRSSLEQVLDVLLDNALHMTPGGGSVLVAVHTAASEARVEVRDQGPGMTNEEISHACEPFWRGSSGRDRKGTGLGLTIAAGLLAASGGRLELGRSPVGGLRAVAVLPRAE
ncbi:histidine kinase [Streptomyces bingchenggensis BCW-1]|uniref:histidine kinase n=1 Tax=Streptomyces bingchenggensis (strain BCW-1) TaxID=749414 RepID=D7BUX9_STRBB|nr:MULTISPECIES: HAMP domain-containing sensor histidine kinase [Streptomyces]ADI05358.1 histidine kinase [Streptomyces bingchenggensis BCW-1]